MSQKLQYVIRSKADINDAVIKKFQNLVNILIVRFGVIDKIQDGDKNQIISHLISIYPQDDKRVFNQNFYFTIAYHKLLNILYRKNKHVSYADPGVQQMINKGIDIFKDQYRQKDQRKKFIKFLINKLVQVNKFNKVYYLIIIKKLWQFLSNPNDRPLKRKQIIKQIHQHSYRNGKTIPKSYIYRVFYVLKKNYGKWKRQYAELNDRM